MSILNNFEDLKNRIDKSVKQIDGISPLSHLDTSFAIVAVRCNSEYSTGKRKLAAGTIYYFLDGYSIDNDIVITGNRENLNNIYDDYLCHQGSDNIHVQISALVGQNGSGKSSIIEFVMRLINNFAAKTFGEWKNGESSERLHFIHGVSGDLWYIVERKFYQLRIENSNVSLSCLGEVDKPICHDINECNTIISDGDRKVSGPQNILGRMGDDELRSLYDHFFYTLVSNYSLYAYNTNDFHRECDSDEKERLVSASSYYQSFPAEERCWLNGLFHKNDGYQTPMVITPFRSEGNINVNRENSLAKERLISLLIRQEEFRKINNHLIAYGLTYIPKDCLKYGIDAIKKDFGMSNLRETGYEAIKAQIIELWGNAIKLDLTCFSNKPLYNLAVDYLVYKTIKIAYTYRQHNEEFTLLSSIEDVYNPELVEEMVTSQIKDLSHITRKIHQTIAYLIYNVYSYGLKDRGQGSIRLNKLYELWKSEVFPKFKESSGNFRNSLAAAVMEQSVIPPPFMQTTIMLNEEGKQSVTIDFETLSSGEKQQIYAISSVLYHLDNLDSVKYDKSDPYRIPYRNVLLIFEEIELYFHPELQQQFIKQLLDGIKRYDFNSITGIHIILGTHSPYVLSDIPQENVLALTKEGLPSEKKLKTFCANIHEMLKDSFFLSHGSQGDFAQWEIGHIMACLEIHRNYKNAYCNNQTDEKTKQDEWYRFVSDLSKDESNVYSFSHRYIGKFHNSNTPYLSYEDFCLDFSEEKLRERIGIIDEPLIRSILFKELNDVFAKTEEEKKQAKIQELEMELNRLKGE